LTSGTDQPVSFAISFTERSSISNIVITSRAAGDSCSSRRPIRPRAASRSWGVHSGEPSQTPSASIAGPAARSCRHRPRAPWRSTPHRSVPLRAVWQNADANVKVPVAGSAAFTPLHGTLVEGRTLRRPKRRASHDFRACVPSGLHLTFISAHLEGWRCRNTPSLSRLTRSP
jgi:hypothetical protein